MQFTNECLSHLVQLDTNHDVVNLRKLTCGKVDFLVLGLVRPLRVRPPLDILLVIAHQT